MLADGIIFHSKKWFDKTAIGAIIVFEQLVHQLTAGKPRISKYYHKENTEEKSIGNSVPIKMRNVKTGEILTFANFLAATKHFDMSDRRFIKSLVDNPSKVWRGYQAKEQDDNSDWVKPQEPVEPYAHRRYGSKQAVFLITYYTKTGLVKYLCSGYREASVLTGKSKSYLAKKICYNITTVNYDFTIQHATHEDLDNFPNFKFCRDKMYIAKTKH